MIPAGDVPESLVNPPGKERIAAPADQEAVMVTAMKMFFVTHGFAALKPAVRVPEISETFRGKMTDAGIIPVGNGVYCDYQMILGRNVLQLKDNSGKIVFEKKICVQQ